MLDSLLTMDASTTTQADHPFSKEGFMPKNMGTTDRVITPLAATLLGLLIATGTISGTIGTMLGILAGVFVITRVASLYPLYRPS